VPSNRHEVFASQQGCRIQSLKKKTNWTSQKLCNETLPALQTIENINIRVSKNAVTNPPPNIKTSRPFIQNYLR